MIKTLVVSLSLLSFTPSLSSASEIESCFVFSYIFGEVAEARDRGVPPEKVLEVLTENGISFENAIEILESVYISGSHFTAEEIKEMAVDFCIKGLV